MVRIAYPLILMRATKKATSCHRALLIYVCIFIQLLESSFSLLCCYYEEKKMQIQIAMLMNEYIESGRTIVFLDEYDIHIQIYL